MRTFRAATLNIWNRFGPWDERLRAIREGLRTVDPDVIGMQEVLRTSDLDQAAAVSEGLGYDVAWGVASENHGFPVGNAILSKWPILTHERIALPDGGSDERRCLLYALIDAPFGKLPFFCTHLNWKLHHGHVRQLQVKAIAQEIARLAPMVDGVFPPVLVGDLNAGPDADEIRFLKGLTGLGGECVYFADSFELAGDGSVGATFSKTNPFAEPLREPERRIDYVFVRGPDDAQRGEPTEARVCFDRPYEGTFPSDHYGVVATITAGR
ncbi:MAG: endonuclease/exonuclease/phosphatase family protein [Labilithrix sp.]|nr:endonuclease/exonuclease/phosphatase family protein [Labilithrix sp.]MCW5814837.1 endonuclease/exonuclease/phosphatase family protein [Labilithrix sp.]